MTKTYRDSVTATIHETASGLHEIGILDQQTMREFDDLYLTPIRPMTGDAIRALRERDQVSQAVFARHLNVTKGLVSQWERRPASLSSLPSRRAATRVAV